MSFRGLLRPGQGFRQFRVLRRTGGVNEFGRPYTKELEPQGEFFGIISQADPKEVEQWKQLGNPITDTIVQRGTKNRAQANDILELVPPKGCTDPGKPRRFMVKGKPKDPGELGHFLIYHVEEREDL